MPVLLSNLNFLDSFGSICTVIFPCQAKMLSTPFFFQMCTSLLNPFLLEGYTDHGFSHHVPHSKDLSSIWTKTVDRYLPIKRILHPRDPLDLGASVSAQEMTEWHRSYIRASITTPLIRRHHTFAASHASGARASCSRCSGTSMDAAKPAPRCARTFVFEVCNLASASRASCPSRSKPSGLQGWGTTAAVQDLRKKGWAQRSRPQLRNFIGDGGNCP